MNKDELAQAVAEGLADAVPFWYLIGAGVVVGVVCALAWAVLSR